MARMHIKKEQTAVWTGKTPAGGPNKEGTWKPSTAFGHRKAPLESEQRQSIRAERISSGRIGTSLSEPPAETERRLQGEAENSDKLTRKSRRARGRDWLLNSPLFWNKK
jgi:hypothetical protein